MSRFLGVADVRGADECWPWTGYINPRTGYGQMSLNLAEVEVFGHRIVTAPVVACTLAHGRRPPGLEVLHACDEKNCANPAHLRWGTRAENNREAWDRGRQLSGERHHRAKITDDQLRELARRATAGESVKALAAEFGVDWSLAYSWLRGKGRGRILEAR